MRNNAILSSDLTSFRVAYFRYLAWRLFVFSTFRLALLQGEKTKTDARRKYE